MNNPFEALTLELSQIKELLLELKDSPKAPPSNKLYSVKDLASQCGVAELTIRNWIIEGKVKAKRLGRRIFIEESEFRSALADAKSLKYKRA